MKTLLLICLFIGSGSFTSALRPKRSLDQFRQMIACLTDKDPIGDYYGYGCWCGYLGKGNPVDGVYGTDRCCKTHDECYDTLKADGTCGFWQVYYERYSFTRHNCDTPSAYISCGSGDSCEVGLCQCDKAAVECFRSATFNSAYRNYDNDNC